MLRKAGYACQARNTAWNVWWENEAVIPAAIYHLVAGGQCEYVGTCSLCPVGTSANAGDARTEFCQSACPY